MFQSVRRKKRSQEKAEITIAPLIDMVFILLIFFIVTTSFVSETGVTVERPAAHSAENLESQSTLVGIGPSGEIYISGRRVGLFSLKPLMENKLKNQPNLSIVLVADKATRADLIVRVMDEIRLSGIKRIAIATERENK
ncbi:MAG: biopolymer transporter ExbD [Phycisphaerae bacterium]|nr:biopolymer transporter ExbD [Phycisphaerae bacterium]